MMGLRQHLTILPGAQLGTTETLTSRDGPVLADCTAILPMFPAADLRFYILTIDLAPRQVCAAIAESLARFINLTKAGVTLHMETPRDLERYDRVEKFS